eukprot:m.89864 g.89864  ORF g.89864 m.89864 type:complete len:308 (+) comp14595_c0_seq1:128-1051(+)
MLVGSAVRSALRLRLWHRGQSQRYRHCLSATGDFNVTQRVIEEFQENGFIIIRSLLSQQELTKIQYALEHDDAIQKHAFEVNDGDQGSNSKLCLWNHPGNDVTGILARSEKVAGTAGKLLGEEVYHYHTKLMMKEAYTGGAFVWHQDYGYWYQNGCLFPTMLTAFIAIDKCTRENGCMQVLQGSHRAGRIEHRFTGEQTGADLERVDDLAKRCPEVLVELEPGDTLFFHCNLLHKSNKNRSPFRRWAFLCAYNTKSNNPTKQHHHPQYTPLDIVPNSAILACENTIDTTGKDFMDPRNDKTTLAAKS